MDARVRINQIGRPPKTRLWRKPGALHRGIAKIGVRKRTSSKTLASMGGDHRPRMSSIKLSTEGAQDPRDCRYSGPSTSPDRASSAPFVKTMEPFSTWNSTSEFCPSPNLSRMSFGIVTLASLTRLSSFSMDRYSFYQAPSGRARQPVPSDLPRPWRDRLHFGRGKILLESAKDDRFGLPSRSRPNCSRPRRFARGPVP